MRTAHDELAQTVVERDGGDRDQPERGERKLRSRHGICLQALEHGQGRQNEACVGVDWIFEVAFGRLGGQPGRGQREEKCRARHEDRQPGQSAGADPEPRSARAAGKHHRARERHRGPHVEERVHVQGQRENPGKTECEDNKSIPSVLEPAAAGQRHADARRGQNHRSAGKPHRRG